jgi:hypothetical protein
MLSQTGEKGTGKRKKLKRRNTLPQIDCRTVTNGILSKRTGSKILFSASRLFFEKIFHSVVPSTKKGRQKAKSQVNNLKNCPAINVCPLAIVPD